MSLVTLAKTYMPKSSNHNINDAIMDTLYSQTNEIKNIKLELINLDTKLNILVNKNSSNKAKKY